MNFRNCKSCRKIFQHMTGSKEQYCPTCKTRILEESELLNKIIDSNKNITLNELADQSKISKKNIDSYIKSKRIPVVKGYVYNKCLKCGDNIISGKICSKCLKTKG